MPDDDAPCHLRVTPTKDNIVNARAEVVDRDRSLQGMDLASRTEPSVDIQNAIMIDFLGSACGNREGKLIIGGIGKQLNLRHHLLRRSRNSHRAARTQKGEAATMIPHHKTEACAVQNRSCRTRTRSKIAAHQVTHPRESSTGNEVDVFKDLNIAIDRADRDAGRKVMQPLQVLWGENGVIEKCFKPLEDWSRVAVNVRGGSVPCGHYIPEEAPEALLAAALPFLLGK